MKKPLVMLLAGGGGTRLGVLVKKRAKPAVPFAGRYRIIDFALSNVMHAGFDWVGVLTQYKPLSLMRHVGVGGAWNLRGRRRGVRILPPRTGEEAGDWYRGTADAIWQNFNFMKQMSPERVLILSGDHIYRMDYRKMLEHHLSRNADLTIAVMNVDPMDVSRFGMVWTDEQGLVTRFEEKPKKADTRLASMGIYLFEWECLVDALESIVATKQGFDFGFDIMAKLLGEKRVSTHLFEGYWRDVGTISSYYNANMDALDIKSGLDLDRWEICTKDDDGPRGDQPPAVFSKGSRCVHSLVSSACLVRGNVKSSILSPGVRIEPGATVESCILMDGVVIHSGAHVKGALLDKRVQVGKGTSIDAGRAAAENLDFSKCILDGLSVVGKGVEIPDGVRIGANVVIDSDVSPDQFKDHLPDGSSLCC